MDEMTKITIEAVERIDDFMFKVMRPFCEDVSEMKMSKDDLKDALQLWAREKKKEQQEPKTISQMLEDIAHEMCDHYCKYSAMEPPEGKDENWLLDDDSPCQMCPLQRL